MKINTVALLGAGAIGAYFIWGLSEKLGENLWVIADGDRKERLDRDGILINGENYRLNVHTPEAARGADLLLVSTKYGALPEALAAIETIVGENTTVLSLLNGVDSEEIIGKQIGMEHMLFSMMKIVSRRKENQIFFDGETTPGLFFGEKGLSLPSARMRAVAKLLDGTPLHYQMSENIMADIWGKYIVNISRNLPQAIIGCGAGAYEDSEPVRFIAGKMREEVIAVAAARGIDLSAAGDAVSRMVAADKSARYSTLQDLDAGRHTEIDMFSGTLVKLGREAGVPTPYNELTYYLIKALEEKNDGKFDYPVPHGT